MITDFTEATGAKHATFITDKLGFAPVIVTQFRQLLYHLIDNALKFSSPDRPPLITLESRLIKGSEVDMPTLLVDQTYCHITFGDNGIGFDSQYSEKIFGIFQRLQVQALYKGTGMGLALVRKIVENHCGLIKATGKLDKGAQFDLYLPAPDPS
jgi:two-component system CheB/CheR fusion protein